MFERDYEYEEKFNTPELQTAHKMVQFAYYGSNVFCIGAIFLFLVGLFSLFAPSVSQFDVYGRASSDSGAQALVFLLKLFRFVLTTTLAACWVVAGYLGRLWIHAKAESLLKLEGIKARLDKDTQPNVEE